jgi:Holliday junction DNA helicase RuvA
MIDFISGTIAGKKATQVVVENNGIGYSLFISTNTYMNLPEPGEKVTLNTYLHVREDNIQLFGFSGEKERMVFSGLISVSGIGPKLAQTILSGLQLEELIQAIQGADLARLTSISGVGTKTAQRLIIELKEKFSQLGLIKSKGEDKIILPFLTAVEEEAVLALLSLGYKKPAIEKALAKTRLGEPARTVEELIKEMLKVI